MFYLNKHAHVSKQIEQAGGVHEDYVEALVKRLST